MTRIIVLSKYKEKSNFFYNCLKDNKNYDDIIVYNKHSGSNLLPNIGREVHTIFYHIINNYDNLSDEIFFSQYDSWDHFKMPTHHNYTGHKHLNYFLTAQLYDFIGVRPGRWRKIIEAHITMKFDWINFYESLFEKQIDDTDLEKIISCAPTKYSIFRVTKSAILKYPKSFYERCLSLVDSPKKINNVYYFEYMWRILFTDYGCKNSNYNWLNNKYLLFGTNKPKHLLHKLQGNIYGPIKLSQDGVIAGNSVSIYGSNNESFWKIVNNDLLIFRSDGALTSKFDITNIKWDYKKNGIFIKNNNEILNNHLWIELIDIQSKY